MSGARCRVAVLGAGIGGLTAAITLASKGIEVDIYEQAPELREVGVGLHLGSNGSRILHRLGLGERLDEMGVRPAALEVRKWIDGQVLTRQPMGEEWAAEFGAPYYTVHRADLLRVLAESVPEGSVHLGRRCVGYTQDEGGVRLEFADGGVASADVLVGADGVHSVVRRAIAGQEAPVFSGTSAYRGLIPTAGLPSLPAETMFIWVGAEVKLLCYPVASGNLLTFVAVVPDAEGSAESWSLPGERSDVAAALAGWDPTVQAMIERIGEVRRWALYDREPLSHWSEGRTTLLGDAAHPMLPHHGQGANQAIEDAVALATCLDRTPDDVEAALLRYDAIRRPHTAQVQTGSRGGGTMRLRPPGPEQGGAKMSSLVDDASWIQRYDIEQEMVSPVS